MRDRRYSSTILDLGSRWKGWVSLTSRLFYPGTRAPVPIEQEAGWAPEPVWTLWRREMSGTVGNRTWAVQPVVIPTSYPGSSLRQLYFLIFVLNKREIWEYKFTMFEEKIQIVGLRHIWDTIKTDLAEIWRTVTWTTFNGLKLKSTTGNETSTSMNRGKIYGPAGWLSVLQELLFCVEFVSKFSLHEWLSRNAILL
jgi:hypothetical protein